MSAKERIRRLVRWTQRKWVLVLAGIIWAAGLLALFFQTDFPDAFDLHPSGGGKAKGFELYFYSPLLITHPTFWNVVLFFWMWAMPAWAVFPLIKGVWRRLTSQRSRKGR